EAFRTLEVERAALERERGELGQLLAHASQERAARAEAEWAATAAVGTRAQQAAALELAAAEAAEQLERARRQVAELRERETRRPWTRSAAGTSRHSLAPWCCSPACPARRSPPTATPWKKVSAWTGRRRRGCARCSRDTRCWTARAGAAARCAGPTVPCSSRVGRPARAAAGRCSGAPTSRRWRRKSRRPKRPVGLPRPRSSARSLS